MSHAYDQTGEYTSRNLKKISLSVKIRRGKLWRIMFFGVENTWALKLLQIKRHLSIHSLVEHRWLKILSLERMDWPREKQLFSTRGILKGGVNNLVL